jgi:hypothetical protein
MRTKKFLYNSTAAASHQLIIAAVGFIVPRIMLQYYGSEVNGLVSSISQFIAYFRLVEAGLSGAAIYALYKPLAEKNFKGINGVVSAAQKFYTQAGYIFLSLVIGFSIIYPCLITTHSLSKISVGLLVLILGTNGALEFFTLSKYRVLLSADQKTYVVSLASIVQLVLSTIIIIVLSKLDADVVVVQAVALISIFLRSAILMFYVRSKYRYINYQEQPDNKALNKRWDAFYLQLLGTTQQGAPVILATVFTTLKTVSVYTIYNMVLIGINSILSIFISGLSASFGDVIARGEKQILQKAYQEFEFAYYSIIAIVYSITLATIMPFIRLYTKGITDVNYDLPLVGFLFVLNGWLYNIKTPQGMLVISAGMYRETRVQSTIQAAIIIVVGFVLAPQYGLAGILIASCLSNIYRDIDLVCFIPRNVTGLPVKNTVYRIIRMVVAMFIIWIPVQYINSQTTNFMQWSLFAFLTGIYAIIVVLLLGLICDKEQLYSVLKRVKTNIKIKEGINK